MGSKQQELCWHFRTILGALSIQEIMTNKEEIKRAELIEILFLKMTTQQGGDTQMKLLCNEIIRFIQSISPREFKNNTNLKGKVAALIKCLNSIPLSPKGHRLSENKKVYSSFYKYIV